MSDLTATAITRADVLFIVDALANEVSFSRLASDLLERWQPAPPEPLGARQDANPGLFDARPHESGAIAGIPKPYLR